MVQKVLFSGSFILSVKTQNNKDQQTGICKPNRAPVWLYFVITYWLRQKLNGYLFGVGGLTLKNIGSISALSKNICGKYCFYLGIRNTTFMNAIYAHTRLAFAAPEGNLMLSEAQWFSWGLLPGYWPCLLRLALCPGAFKLLGS